MVKNHKIKRKVKKNDEASRTDNSSNNFSLSEKNIKYLKKKADDYDLKKDQIRPLKLLQVYSVKDSISLGILFVSCFGHLKSYSEYLSLSVVEKLNPEDYEEFDTTAYLSKFDFVDDLRNLVELYGNGKNYGSYINGEKIKLIVNPKREDINKLINLFFIVFGD